MMSTPSVAPHSQLLSEPFPNVQTVVNWLSRQAGHDQSCWKAFNDVGVELEPVILSPYQTYILVYVHQLLVVVTRLHWTPDHKWRSQPYYAKGGQRPTYMVVRELQEILEVPDAVASYVDEQLHRLEG